MGDYEIVDYKKSLKDIDENLFQQEHLCTFIDPSDDAKNAWTVEKTIEKYKEFRRLIPTDNEDYTVTLPAASDSDNIIIESTEVSQRRKTFDQLLKNIVGED